MVEFTMLIPIWLPLLVGTLWIGSSMIREQQVTQMARDLGSMYSRGTDFSTATGSAAANGTLTQITQQLGSLDPSNGTGVVYFSTITYAGNSYCYDAGNPTYGTKSGTTYSRTGACTNYGRFVFTEQYAKGNTSLTGGSIFGTPTGPFIVTTTPPITTTPDITGADSVSRTGNLSSFNLISPLPQENGQDGYQSGQPIYVVEVYFKSNGILGFTQGGDSAYAVF
jgi:Flp pilus assembly protein TadG